MTKAKHKSRKRGLSNILLARNTRMRTRPVWFASPGSLGDDLAPLTKAQRAWLHTTQWKPDAGKPALLPGPDGQLSGVVVGAGPKSMAGDISFLMGALPGKLLPGAYHFERPPPDPELAAVAWLMDSYQFLLYSETSVKAPRHLKVPAGADEAMVLRIANGVALGRDLINTPANDMGPSELAAAALHLADNHGADIIVTKGGDLLKQGFPLIHAVGRASDRAPLLIDMTWGDDTDPKVTLVGKGICFDTGGLNLKPGNSMALMKKDMGGAASALALGTMIMSAALPVRLRILIPAADNNVSANAFRPGDILTSRKGLTVEIGNTDAEGRLVLADALFLADEEKPDLLIDFATLTGAARVALGPDIPPFYTDDDQLAQDLTNSGKRVCDPMWRMPFWMPYDRQLNGRVADLSNITESPFAGSLTAALFLKRFQRHAKQYVHFDIYGWVPKEKPAFSRGGEPQTARALFDYLRNRFPV